MNQMALKSQSVNKIVSLMNQIVLKRQPIIQIFLKSQSTKQIVLKSQAINPIILKS